MRQLSKGSVIECPLPKAWQVKGESVLYLHAFGNRAGDIDIHFDLSNRPQLITDILVNCCQAKDDIPEVIWSLPISSRLKALLLLVEENTPRPWIVKHQCKQCQEVMEFSFETAELMKLIDEHNQAQIKVPINDSQLILQRPCGYHQRDWQAKDFHTEQAATMGIIQSLAVDPLPDQFWDESLDNELVAKIEAVMDEFDPIINYSIITTCPFCEQEQQISIAWEEECLNRLKRKQQ
ncbi:hypothetical protein KAR34_12650, partial [bacterium]|nr:hypothetical protein [bacterium]